MKRLLAPLLVTFALAGGVAYATIPDGGGVIHACYDKQSGQARIFDPAGGAIKGCGKTESDVSWNQTGPQGPAGPTGAPGTPGQQGLKGDKGDTGNLALAGQSCPSGEFVSGFDAGGAIVCGGVGPPPPPPPPPRPIDCDDGDPNTFDSYDVITGTRVHTL